MVGTNTRIEDKMVMGERGAHRRRPGTSSRDRQREETRQRVYAAALQIFRRDGVAQSRIDEIATTAGVSQGTFYFHFPTKDDVLAELLQISEARISAEIEKLTPDVSPLDLLGCFSVAMAREWREDRSIFPNAAMVGLRLAAAGGAGREAGGLRPALAARFAHAMERGALASPLLPEVLADFFLANTCAAALAWCGNPAAPLESVLSAVAHVFLNGAAPKHEGARSASVTSPRCAS